MGARSARPEDSEERRGLDAARASKRILSARTTSLGQDFLKPLAPLVGFALYQFWTFAFFFAGGPHGAAYGDDVTMTCVRAGSLVTLCAALAIACVSSRAMRLSAGPAALVLCAATLTACVPLSPHASSSTAVGLLCLVAVITAQGIGTAVIALTWVRALRLLPERLTLIGMLFIGLMDVGLFLATHSREAMATSLLYACPLCSIALGILGTKGGDGKTPEEDVTAQARRRLLPFFACWTVIGSTFGLMASLTDHSDSADRVFPWMVLFALMLLTALCVVVLGKGRARRNGDDAAKSGGGTIESEPPGRARVMHASPSAPLFTIAVIAALLVSLAALPHVDIPTIDADVARDLSAFICNTFIELFTLFLFAEYSRKEGIPADLAFSIGGAGRSAGAALGSVVGASFGKVALSASNGTSTVVLVIASQVVIAFALWLAIAPKRAQPREEQRWQSPISTRCHALATTYLLTEREEEVMVLLCKGRSIERIQAELGIAKGTATAHAHHIYQKLGIHSRQELLDMVDNRRQK